MPISIKDLALDTRDVVVHLGEGVDLTITYRPHWYTLAIEERLATLSGVGIHTASVFCEMVIDWDLVDDKGKKVPITVEAIKANNIPTRVLSMGIDAITDDMRPKETRLNGSSRS